MNTIHTIDLNGLLFDTERDKDYFLKNRSPRLNKKLYTGDYLTLVFTVNIRMTIEHHDNLIENIKSNHPDDDYLLDSLIDLSYTDCSSPCTRKHVVNKNFFLGMTFSSFDRVNGYFETNSTWEINAKDKETYIENIDNLLNHIADIFKIYTIIPLHTKEGMDYTDKIDEYDNIIDNYPYDNVIGYSETPLFIYD